MHLHSTKSLLMIDYARRQTHCYWDKPMKRAIINNIANARGDFAWQWSSAGAVELVKSVIGLLIPKIGHGVGHPRNNEVLHFSRVFQLWRQIWLVGFDAMEGMNHVCQYYMKKLTGIDHSSVIIITVVKWWLWNAQFSPDWRQGLARSEEARFVGTSICQISGSFASAGSARCFVFVHITSQ